MASDRLFQDEYNLKSLTKVGVGSFDMFVTPRYIGHYANQSYVFEPFSSEVVRKYLSSIQSPIFVDVGAHYGFYTLLAKEANKKTKIVAIEPVPENFKILHKNVRLNKLKDTELLQVAASSKKGESTFNLTEASDSAGFYQHPLTKVSKKISVVTDKLDAILEKRSVDFIKIDVEGHESAVLDGLAQTVRQQKTLALMVEFCPDLQQNADVSPRKLLNKIFQMGFKIFVIDEGGQRLLPLGPREGWKSYLAGKMYVNLLCQKGNPGFLTEYVYKKNRQDREYQSRFSPSQQRMVSYAQNGEDVVLNRIFQGKKKGFYIDIGAADPIADSVTKHFYLLGWRGINVEPLQVPYTKLVSDRPDDVNLHAAAGADKATTLFYQCDRVPDWSTMSGKVAKEHEKRGVIFKKQPMRVITLRDICSAYVTGDIDFLKIDVEGFEKEVLAGNDWKKYRPKVVVVESTFPKKWEGILLGNGYLSALNDGLNRFYVRKESKRLLGAAMIPANVLDNYDPFRYLNSIVSQGQGAFESERRVADLVSQLNTITGAKAYRIWQAYCRIRDTMFPRNREKTT